MRSQAGDFWNYIKIFPLDALFYAKDCVEWGKVTDVNYLRLEKTTETTYVLSGGFDCEVSDWIDYEDGRYFTMIFPASFSLLYRMNNEKWELSENGSKVSVNTDSFYR